MKTKKDTRKVITKKKNDTPIYIHFVLYDTNNSHIDSFKVIEWSYETMSQLAIKDKLIDKKTFKYDDAFNEETKKLSEIEFYFLMRSRFNERLKYYIYTSEDTPFTVEDLELYLRTNQRKEILKKLESLDHIY